MKRLLLILGTAILAAVPAGIPVVASAGPDNSAVAINTKDGNTVWRISMKVTRTNTNVLNTVNMALAYSSCTGCSTYAIAFDVVIDGNNPDVVTPENLAKAVNYECTECTTFADAIQFVIATDTPMKFTAQGHQELVTIRQDLKALRDSSYANLDELRAAVHAIAVRLAIVLRDDLVPQNDPAGI